MEIIKKEHHAEKYALATHVIDGITEVNLLENVKLNKYCKHTVPNIILFKINKKTAKK